VVIGIIAVLAALLFPVFSAARAKAQATQCLSNLHQLGLAVAMYAGDYDELFPYGVDSADRDCPTIWNAYPQWEALIPTLPYINAILTPYTKSAEVWHCPCDSGYDTLEDEPLPRPGRPTGFQVWGSSYDYRTELAFSQVTVAQIPDPTQVNVLFDSWGGWHGGLIFDKKRWNMLFADGHVKTVDRTAYDAAWSAPVH
jgi:general secretion pathway protein G